MAFNLNRIGQKDQFRYIINNYFCNCDVENLSDSSDESDEEHKDVSPSTINN